MGGSNDNGSRFGYCETSYSIQMFSVSKGARQARGGKSEVRYTDSGVFLDTDVAEKRKLWLGGADTLLLLFIEHFFT